MKSSIWCAFMIAMLLVSNVAFGEIVNDGDYTEDEYGMGSATVTSGQSLLVGYAVGSDPFGYGYGEGWQSSYTTEAGWFEWEAYIYTWTEAHLWLWSGQTCGAYAYAEASIDTSPDGPDDLSAEAVVVDSGYNGYDPNEWDNGGYPSGITQSSTSPFDPLEGVSTQHTGDAIGSVAQDAHNTAFALADVRTWCSMSEH